MPTYMHGHFLNLIPKREEGKYDKPKEEIERMRTQDVGPRWQQKGESSCADSGGNCLLAKSVDADAEYGAGDECF